MDQTQLWEEAEAGAKQARVPVADRVPRWNLNETKTQHVLNVYFDGGCEPNPGNKYGSFEITLDGMRICSQSRFLLGHGTNNEAEFEALEAALLNTLMLLKENGVRPSDCSLTIETDSMIVRNRLMKQNKVHKKAAWRDASERMFNLANRCLEPATKFKEFCVNWERRDANVERFGH